MGGVFTSTEYYVCVCRQHECVINNNNSAIQRWIILLLLSRGPHSPHARTLAATLHRLIAATTHLTSPFSHTFLKSPYLTPVIANCGMGVIRRKYIRKKSLTFCTSFWPLHHPQTHLSNPHSLPTYTLTFTVFTTLTLSTRPSPQDSASRHYLFPPLSSHLPSHLHLTVKHTHSLQRVVSQPLSRPLTSNRLKWYQDFFLFVYTFYAYFHSYTHRFAHSRSAVWIPSSLPTSSSLSTLFFLPSAASIWLTRSVMDEKREPEGARTWLRDENKGANH